jgi:hypothetical protein
MLNKTQECSVVISFFSPVAYQLPRQHFNTVMHSMHCQGVPLVVTQALFPGQNPLPVPSCIPNMAYRTKSLMFHKERLWNLGANLVKTKKIIWLDGDVVFRNTNWLDKSIDLLNYFDVIQPFENSYWLDSNGLPDTSKPSMAKAIASNETPKLSFYHPGFGWGMTRKAFDELGGFYDAAVTGNSDALFALGLRSNDKHSAIENWYSKVQDPHVFSPTYQQFKERARRLRITVGFPSGVDVFHMYHGEKKDRQYITREKLFPRKENNEYDIKEGDDGLQEWRDVEKANRSIEPYFINKKDDG